MIHLANVRRDPSTPIAAVHAMLYAYHPQAGQGERTFVWRLLAPDRIAMLSATPSTAPDRRTIALEPRATYDFELVVKRARNATLGEARKQVEVEITDPAELRERIVRYAAERGLAIGFSRVTHMMEMKLVSRGRRMRVPIGHIAGKALVTDAAAAERLLATGGPGTGKAWGLGLWWLPELMVDAPRIAA